MAATLAIVGANIRTLDPARPLVEALAIKDDRIIALGAEVDVREHIDATTEVIDAHGGTLTPGFVDSHQHLLHGAVMAQGIDFDRVATLDRVRELVHEARSVLGAGAWVQGFALEYRAFGGRAYHHDFIDAAGGAGPVIIYSLDVHTAFVNEHALRLAGIEGPRSFGDGSIIACDDNGRPTGELRETEAMDLVAHLVPKPPAEVLRRWYREAMAAQNAVGLTGVQLMDGDPESVALFGDLEATGELTLRVNVHQFIAPTASDDEVEAIFEAGAKDGRLFTADGVKFMIDGVIDTGTAWLDEPDQLGAGVESMWGDIAHFRRRVRQVHEAGFAIATHAIGDRGVREVLDAYAALPTSSENGRARRARRRIEHIEMVPDATVARFAAEGVVASVQPSHVRWLKPDLSDPWSRRLDGSRCAHAFRSGDLAASGAMLVLGSDWPVAPFDPRQGFYAAQTRHAHDVPDDRPIGSSQALTPAQALAGYTRNPAVAMGDAEVGGMIREGYRADLVLWGDDPVRVAAADVVDLPVALTVVAGRVVHRAG